MIVGGVMTFDRLADGLLTSRTAFWSSLSHTTAWRNMLDKTASAFRIVGSPTSSAFRSLISWSTIFGLN